MIRILHLLPGRMRLRLEALKGRPELASMLQSHLATVSGIGHVAVDTRTGSLLLLYDPTALRSPAFIDAFSAAMGKLFPTHFAPGRIRFSVKRLKGHPDLARKIEQHLSAVWGIHQIEIDSSTGNCRLVYDSSAVTTPEFLYALSRPLGALVPHVDVKKLMRRAGFQF